MRVPAFKKAVIRCLIAGLLALPILFFGHAYAERLPIKNYTTADGLARNSVYRIIQDSRGFIWFCTAEGLSRFDGYKFANYTEANGLPGRAVTDMIETGSGQYLIATNRGLCRLNPAGVSGGKTGSNQSVQKESRSIFDSDFASYDPADIHSGRKSINALLQDRSGALWCGTFSGLYRLELAEGQTVMRLIDIGLPSRSGDDPIVQTIMEDKRGALWIGTRGSGLYRRWPSGAVERYTIAHGLPANDIRRVLEDDKGQLWVGTTMGLCRIAPNPRPERPLVTSLYTKADGLPSDWVSDVFQSSGGSIWVGTTKGLCECTGGAGGSTLELHTYTAANGLGDLPIETLTEDREGNLWIGTDNSGAMKMARSGLITYGELDGLGGPDVRSILESREGELCVFTGNGVNNFINRLDGSRFLTVPLNIPRNITNPGWGWNQFLLEDRAGKWWVPTGQGLCRFPSVKRIEELAYVTPEAVYTTRDGLQQNEVFRLFEDSEGDIWVATVSGSEGNGLARWDRATRTLRNISDADGLSIKQTACTAFCQDASGALWIGRGGDGLIRHERGRFTVFRSENGLPPGPIMALYLDRSHRLWIATDGGGLARIEDPASGHPDFVTYTTAQGLSSNEVFCVTQDDGQRIYIGTGGGVDRLDPATGYLKHYSEADGLIRGEVRVAYRDRQGRLWFGGATGLSRLVPETDSPRPPPPIVISGLRIGGVAHNLSILGEADVPGLELAPSQNQVEVEFVGLGFGVGEALRYQYKLEGADADWSPPGEQRRVNYASLSPGSYRFMARAINSDGLGSPSPATVELRILRPVWQRWWFVVLAALVFGLTIYGAYRFRVARLLELERVRTRIAADLHDDIGSNLTKIAILSEVVRQQAGSDGLPIAGPLSSIAGIARESVASMSDIVWAINPKRDRLRYLARRMRLFASDIFTARGIDFQFIAPVAEADLELGADLRRQVFLIFKESVNNIVRHSCCARADIELTVEKAWLVLRVRDDGKGFDPQRETQGQGLAGMLRRARLLGGEVEILSGTGRGTTVTLRVPRSGRAPSHMGMKRSYLNR